VPTDAATNPYLASTAYDVLRANGVPLGKRYFLGALKLKG
jgi:hypothetical protein